MKKNNFLKQSIILLAIQFIAISIYSQNSVVTYTDNGGNMFFDIPDVNNKLQAVDILAENQGPVKSPEVISVFPNWPIDIQGGPSNRAGIYANMDDDPELEVIYNIRQKVFVWNVDGSEVDGWPQTVSNGNNFLWRGPAFGDVNGDGEGDIVVSTGFAGTGVTGWLFAFNKNGTPIDGFPFELPDGGGNSGPVLADLNGDGALEIIVAQRGTPYPTGFIGVYDGNGNIFPGFPQQMDHVPASKVAVGDINDDGIPEIIAESYISVFAFDVDGNSLPGFPYNLGDGSDRALSYSSPVLADITGNGNREIIFGDHALTAGNGAVHILKSDGTLLEGWPQYTSHWIYAPPSVSDLDGDGELDIAIGDKYSSASPASKVYVWDKDGNMLPGWPSDYVNSVNSQIIIANLDGDDDLEMIWDDNTPNGKYIGYNHDGTPMGGDWPLITQSGFSTFFTNPFVMDIDNDGMLDISGACSDDDGNYKFYLWNTDVTFDPLKAILPVIQYNVQHTGVYGTSFITNINDAFVENQISVYPNPSSGIFTIKNPEDKNTIIDVLTVAGKIVYSLKISSGFEAPFKIDISDQNDGIYILRYFSGDKYQFRKIIKQ